MLAQAGHAAAGLSAAGAAADSFTVAEAATAHSCMVSAYQDMSVLAVELS
jgi:hypothetical protein